MGVSLAEYIELIIYKAFYFILSVIFLHQGIITVGIQWVQIYSCYSIQHQSCWNSEAVQLGTSWSESVLLWKRKLECSSSSPGSVLEPCLLAPFVLPYYTMIKKSYKSTQSLFLMSRIQITVRHLWKKKRGHLFHNAVMCMLPWKQFLLSLKISAWFLIRCDVVQSCLRGIMS